MVTNIVFEVTATDALQKFNEHIHKGELRVDGRRTPKNARAMSQALGTIGATMWSGHGVRVTAVGNSRQKGFEFVRMSEDEKRANLDSYIDSVPPY